MSKRQPRYVETKTTVSAAISDALMECQSLRDEMEEWRSNIEEKFSSTDKYSRIEECVSALENFADNELDVPEKVEELEVIYDSDRKASSRADRLGESVTMLDAARSALEAHCESLRAPSEEERDERINQKVVDGEDVEENDSGTDEDLITEIESLIEEITNIIDEAESVEFVGMFG